MKTLTWDDVVRERKAREDAAVAKQWEAYRHLGRGWLR